MAPRDRRDRIIDLLSRTDRVSVESLAEALDASRETIRRDLAALDRQGLARKIHGGARRTEQIPSEIDFVARMTESVAEKRRIAEAAAQRFCPGDVLFMDAGSTTIYFAERLAQISGLTIITNCVGALRNLSGSDARVFLLGGEYDHAGQETLGPLTEADLGRFRADHAVLTVGAVHEAAILDYDLREASLARAMIAQARHVTVLADHAKFDRPAIFEVAPLSRVDCMITDRTPPPAIAAALRTAGVEVIVV